MVRRYAKRMSLILMAAFGLCFFTPDMHIQAAPEDFEVTDGVLTAYTGSDANVTIPEEVTKIGRAHV